MIAPAALAVSVSLPAAVAVTTTMTCPAELVVPPAGAIELPVADVMVIGKPGKAVEAESVSVKVRVVLEPNASEVLPLILIVVPVTSTFVVPVAPCVVAVTLMIRFDLLAPRLSFAVTIPLASDAPPAGLILVKKALGSVPLENTTVLPETACPVPSVTIAVRSTVVAPDEGICGVLASSWTWMPVGPGVGPGPLPGPVPVVPPNTLEPPLVVSSAQPTSPSAHVTRRAATTDWKSFTMTSPSPECLTQNPRKPRANPAKLTCSLKCGTVSVNSEAFPHRIERLFLSFAITL